MTRLTIHEFVFRYTKEMGVFVYQIFPSDFTAAGNLNDPFDELIDAVGQSNTKYISFAAATIPSFQNRWYSGFSSVDRAIRQFWAAEKLPAPPCPLLRRLVLLSHPTYSENGLWKTTVPDCTCLYCTADQYEDLVYLEVPENFSRSAVNILRQEPHSLTVFGNEWFEALLFLCLPRCILINRTFAFVDILSDPMLVSHKRMIEAIDRSRGGGALEATVSALASGCDQHIVLGKTPMRICPIEHKLSGRYPESRACFALDLPFASESKKRVPSFEVRNPLYGTSDAGDVETAHFPRDPRAGGYLDVGDVGMLEVPTDDVQRSDGPPLVVAPISPNHLYVNDEVDGDAPEIVHEDISAASLPRSDRLCSYTNPAGAKCRNEALVNSALCICHTCPRCQGAKRSKPSHCPHCAATNV